jgi:hypothetical protein
MMMGKRSKGSKSYYLKLKLNLLGYFSYWLAGVLGKIDDEYSATFVKKNGHKRLNELMHEEAEYWKAKYRANK